MIRPKSGWPVLEYPTDYAPQMLETFPNKHPENEYLVTFTCPEFTSLCPQTLLFSTTSFSRARSVGRESQAGVSRSMAPHCLSNTKEIEGCTLLGAAGVEYPTDYAPQMLDRKVKKSYLCDYEN